MKYRQKESGNLSVKIFLHIFFLKVTGGVGLQNFHFSKMFFDWWFVNSTTMHIYAKSLHDIFLVHFT